MHGHTYKPWSARCLSRQVADCGFTMQAQQVGNNRGLCCQGTVPKQTNQSRGLPVPALLQSAAMPGLEASGNVGLVGPLNGGKSMAPRSDPQDPEPVHGTRRANLRAVD